MDCLLPDLEVRFAAYPGCMTLWDLPQMVQVWAALALRALEST